VATGAYPHIEIKDDGVPLVAGTTTKVVEVVLDRLAHHWDAEEIQRQHPHLSLAQIYSALAYYHDHQAEVDQDIADRLNKVNQIAAAQSASVVREKLRTMGNLP
jgi:uncharacterized protein (DUF433 family)